jgi:outer membrane lipoprotein-sorting protein
VALGPSTPRRAEGGTRVRLGVALLAWLTALALAPLTLPPSVHAQAIEPVASLEELMALFASSGGVRAEFVETRELAILAMPIETRGKLYFAPPDRLARHTLEPSPSSVVVQGDRVALRDETGEQVLSLGSSEVARTLVGNTAAMLRGDLDALRARYEIEFEATSDAWLLGLVPRSRVAKAIVERIEVRGSGRALSSMVTLESSGDRATTRFAAVETGVDFSPEELARVFSLESSPREAEAP